MTKKELLLESIFILEDTSAISNQMVKQYQSKGLQRAKQSLLKNTKILSEELKSKGVDVTKIKNDAINVAIGLKPNIQKLIKGEGDKQQLLKVIFNRIQAESKTTLDSIHVKEGTILYASILFLEIFLIYAVKHIFDGQAFWALLIVACFLASILSLSRLA